MFRPLVEVGNVPLDFLQVVCPVWHADLEAAPGCLEALTVFREPEASLQEFVIFVVFNFPIVGQSEKPDLSHAILVLLPQFTLKDNLASALPGLERRGLLLQQAFFDAHKVVEGGQTAMAQFFSRKFLLEWYRTLVHGFKIYA